MFHHFSTCGFMHVPTKTHEYTVYTYHLGLSHETRMGNAQKCINKFETFPKPQNSQIQRGLKMFHPHSCRDNIGFGVPIASIRCRQWRLFRHCAQGIVCAQVKWIGKRNHEVVGSVEVQEIQPVASFAGLHQSMEMSFKNDLFPAFEGEINSVNIWL